MKIKKRKNTPTCYPTPRIGENSTATKFCFLYIKLYNIVMII